MIAKENHVETFLASSFSPSDTAPAGILFCFYMGLLKGIVVQGDTPESSQQNHNFPFASLR